MPCPCLCHGWVPPKRELDFPSHAVSTVIPCWRWEGVDGVSRLCYSNEVLGTCKWLESLHLAWPLQHVIRRPGSVQTLHPSSAVNTLDTELSVKSKQPSLRNSFFCLEILLSVYSVQATQSILHLTHITHLWNGPALSSWGINIHSSPKLKDGDREWCLLCMPKACVC